MADSDLEAIRQARRQELQSSGGGGPSDGQDDGRKNQEAEMRQSILSQILEPAAIDRLNRIRLVKVSRADDVENRLITLARSGQLRSKVSEAQLKEMLEAMSEQQQEAEKVTVQRRKGGWDDDDLDDLLKSPPVEEAVQIEAE